jgi:hypothetical protein
MPDGWIGFPLANTDPRTDVQDFEFLVQFWEATRERQRALGTLRWPRHSEIWYEGTITGFTDNGDDTYTLADDEATWNGGGDNPWAEFDTGAEIPWAPTQWRVFIEWSTDDYRNFVKADVLSWTTSTLTVKSILDYLTSKEVGSLSDLVGKKYVIVRGGLRHLLAAAVARVSAGDGTHQGQPDRRYGRHLRAYD